MRPDTAAPHGFFGFGHHFGDGFGPGGRGGGRGGFGPGRKLGSGDLQLLLLALLAEKPSHGYELIKAIEERSTGYYAPSPGMVYPALTYLEELGHASVEQEGTRKLYRATEAGLKHLADNRAAIDTLLAQLQQIGLRMHKFRRAMQPEGGEDPIAEPEPRLDAGTQELQVARFELKLAVHAKSDAPREEQLRVAQIRARRRTRSATSRSRLSRRRHKRHGLDACRLWPMHNPGYRAHFAACVFR